MDRKSTRSSRKGLLRSRLLSDADENDLLGCGVDPASLPYLLPKLRHRNLLIQGVKLYAANILKQNMLSIGGDVAVHRHVISGKTDSSDCLIMGDLRHYRQLIEKLSVQPGLEELAESIRRQMIPQGKDLELTMNRKTHAWNNKPVIMGILNVTPDSFSDGGRWLDEEAAVRHGREMAEQGADIIDIGGESSRPGADPVSEDEEIARISPVIRELSSLGIPISIDTTKSRVAEAAIREGATMVNDITALLGDPGMMDLVRDTGSAVVLMHMRGRPGTMQQNTGYQDVVGEIYAFLDERIEACIKAGISSSIIVDPGIGFGKDLGGNLSLIRHISEFRSLGVPLLLGHSRKSFIGRILGTEADEREEGTDAVTAWAAIQGVDMVRVHSVARAARIRALLKAVMEAA
jgi:dihydropteroate synthase